jgi:polysaccharide export outer membrane protein
MRQKSKFLWLFASVSFFFTSCLINRDFVFKTDEDFIYQTPKEDTVSHDLMITPYSVLSIVVYSRSGSTIYEATTASPGAGATTTRAPSASSNNQFIVDKDGYVNVPMIGRQKLGGLTIFQAQTFLSSKFDYFFNDSYTLVKVENRRFFYFNGNGGEGQVYGMDLNGVSLIEAITVGGGIGERGDASKVKVIRRVNDKQEVYLFNLSSINGAEYTKFKIESGDIIVVTPMPRYSAETLQIITPALTLFTTVLVFITVMVK